MEEVYLSESNRELSGDMLRIVNYINELFGSYCKLREIHWNTHNKASHDLSDNLMSHFMYTIDRVFEAIMGIEERPGYGIIYPKIPNSSDIKEILKAIIARTTTLEGQLCSPIYSGVCNVLADFKEHLNKSIYLSSLS